MTKEEPMISEIVAVIVTVVASILLGAWIFFQITK